MLLFVMAGRKSKRSESGQLDKHDTGAQFPVDVDPQFQVTKHWQMCCQKLPQPVYRRIQRVSVVLYLNPGPAPQGNPRFKRSSVYKLNPRIGFQSTN
jgi:hypothetical protein